MGKDGKEDKGIVAKSKISGHKHSFNCWDQTVARGSDVL